MFNINQHTGYLISYTLVLVAYEQSRCLLALGNLSGLHVERQIELETLYTSCNINCSLGTSLVSLTCKGLLPGTQGLHLPFVTPGNSSSTRAILTFWSFASEPRFTGAKPMRLFMRVRVFLVETPNSRPPAPHLFVTSKDFRLIRINLLLNLKRNSDN